MTSTALLHAAIRRDRFVVVLGIALIAALAWGYTVHLASRMDGAAMEGATMDGMAMDGAAMDAMLMPMTAAWGFPELLFTATMWMTMMVAMMLPSATPYLVIFARVNRSRRAEGGPFVPTALFALGYLTAWFAFSLAAALAQWGLQTGLLIDADYASATPYLGGGLLVAAGIYQWTPLKYACLANCRSPFGFIANHWREGRLGALGMGFHHGLFCLGCCWLLMALLFVFGVMNLLWIAGLAAFVLVEKLAPGGPHLARAAGLVMIAGGVYLLVAGA